MADSGAAVEHADSGGTEAAARRVRLGRARATPLGCGEQSLRLLGNGPKVVARRIAAAGLSERTAWVSAGRQEHDPQVFWLSVLDSLRQTGAGSERVRELTAAPHLDGANVVGRPPSLELADRFGVPRRA